MNRKYDSGYQKRKRKSKAEELIQSQAGDINKYFSSESSKKKREVDIADNAEKVEFLIGVDSNLNGGESKEGETLIKEGLDPIIGIEDDDPGNDEEDFQPVNVESFDDVGKWEWDYIDQKKIDFLVERGPKRDVGCLFPKDGAKRHFDIVDKARSSIDSRFTQFKRYAETFGFLFSLERLHGVEDESLQRSCANLQNSLTYNDCSDINGDDLFLELTFLKCSLPRETKSVIEVMEYLKKMDGCFPNAYIAYKILLTIPVTVASAERSFSKLKLIKTFLRSTMSQERLNGLSMLSIEKGIIEELDCTDLIDTFATKTVRRVVF